MSIYLGHLELSNFYFRGMMTTFNVIVAVYLLIGITIATVMQILIEKELNSCEHRREDIESAYADAGKRVKDPVLAVFIVGILFWPYILWQVVTKK